MAGDLNIPALCGFRNPDDGSAVRALVIAVGLPVPPHTPNDRAVSFCPAPELQVRVPFLTPLIDIL